MDKAKIRRRKFSFNGLMYEVSVVQTGRNRGRVDIFGPNGKKFSTGRLIDGTLRCTDIDTDISEFNFDFVEAVGHAVWPILPLTKVEREREAYRAASEERKASLAKALQERDEARAAHDQAAVELVKFRAELSKVQTDLDSYKKSFVDEVKRTDKLSREKYDLRNHLKRAVVEVLRAGETATEVYLELHEANDAGPALKRLLEIRNSAKGLLTDDLQKVLVESGHVGTETWGALGMAAWTILGCYAMKPKKEGA